MSVTKGEADVTHSYTKTKLEHEEKRLQEMMIPKKKKKLYSKIIYGQKRKVREANVLKDKRKALDDEDRQAKKAKRKAK